MSGKNVPIQQKALLLIFMETDKYPHSFVAKTARHQTDSLDHCSLFLSAEKNPACNNMH